MRTFKWENKHLKISFSFLSSTVSTRKPFPYLLKKNLMFRVREGSRAAPRVLLGFMKWDIQPPLLAAANQSSDDYISMSFCGQVFSYIPCP